MLRTPTILLIAPLLFPAIALAQAPNQPAEAPAERVTQIDFLKGDDVEGTRDAPAAAFTTGQVRHPRGSLIVVRPTFRPELLASVDAL